MGSVLWELWEGMKKAAGFGDDKPKQPPPDYTAAAEKTARANRPDINNPFGYQKWTQDAQGNWTLDIGFNPQFGGLFGDLSGQLGSAWSTPLSSGEDARKKAEDAYYARSVARLDPMWSSRQGSMESQLAGQGLDIGSEAYRRSMAGLAADRNMSYQQALNESIIGGGAEAQRQQQMDLASRMAPLQALGSLYGMASNTPSFGQGPDYMRALGMQIDDRRMRAQEEAQWISAILSLIGGIGGGIAGGYAGGPQGAAAGASTGMKAGENVGTIYSGSGYV